MIYIYRRKSSNSARILADVLGARRIKNPTSLARIGPQDHLVCWGEHVGGSDGALNNVPLRDKFADAIKLAEAGVSTVEVARIRPPLPEEPPRLDIVVFSVEAAQLGLGQLQDYINRWSVPSAEWLGRSRHHIGGRDLLNPVQEADYFVKREQIAHEYRVHSFLGRSIRAGIKRPAPADGSDPHPWIRSMDGGWKIFYDGRSVRQVHRDLAHRAVSALGLHFGAVDIGERADGSLIVLEVNRAPGLDGGTIDAYARAISEWSEGNTSEPVNVEGGE